mmetsp:Transcript_20275/g.60574  ORF Transcript_20275/g.60574 Transcript_20275/m.60574 type:complete len:235 (+) Transcript_20275:2-706(+)
MGQRTGGKITDTKHVEAIFQKMQTAGLVADSRTYSTMIKYISRACRNPDRAVEWFEKMLAAGFRPRETTYVQIMYGYGSLSAYDKAEAWFTKLSREGGFASNRLGYVALVRMYLGSPPGQGKGVKDTRDDAVERAKFWIEEAEKSGMPPSDLESIYLTAMHGAGWQGQYRLTKKYFEKLVRLGIEPSEDAYRYLIVGAARSGQIGQARRWYRELLKAGHNPSKRTFAAIRMFGW